VPYRGGGPEVAIACPAIGDHGVIERATALASCHACAATPCAISDDTLVPCPGVTPPPSNPPPPTTP
jgi:hypothetical protein